MHIKIKSLNAWSGCCVVNHHTAPNDVVDFIVDTAHETDVFALQEVLISSKRGHKRFIDMEKPGHRPGPVDTMLGNNLIAKLEDTHQIVFSPHFATKAFHDYQETSLPVQTGNMLLVKKGLTVVHISSPHVYRQGELSTQGKLTKGSHPTVLGQPGSRRMQVVTLLGKGELITIANFHGLHSKLGKGVHIPAHYAQASGIAKGLLEHSHHKSIACQDNKKLLLGDFNLVAGMPGFQSIIERTDLWGGEGVNLNETFNILRTRTSHYPSDKPIRVANYATSSACLSEDVYGYTAIENVPSDHMMLSLEIKN